MSDPYHILGGELCTHCGMRFYSRSMGGPGIFPACDCGQFGLTQIKAQGDRIAELEAENDRLNMEMVAYRAKLTPKDVEAMTAVIKALTEEKARRATSQTEANDGWQPIETAPLGGKWVLLWWPEITDCAIEGYRVNDTWRTISDHRSTDGFGGPTHWHPIPAPPLTASKI